jgi:hypothetical protein
MGDLFLPHMDDFFTEGMCRSEFVEVDTLEPIEVAATNSYHSESLLMVGRAVCK